MANESSIITPVRFSYDKQANPTAPLLVRDIAGAIYDINQTGALLTLKVADGLGSFENVEISLNHVSNAITAISTDATISGSHTPQDPLRVTTPLNRENLYGILNQSGDPMLVGGDNITITPSDGSENFTINSTGGTGGLDVDAVDARFVGSEFPADPKTGQTFYLNDVYIFNEIIYSAGWYRWSGTAWIRVKNVGFTIGGNFPTDAFEGHWHRPDVEIEIGDITYAPNKIYEKEGTAWNEVFFGDTVDSPEDIENRATFTLDADDFFPAYKRVHTLSDHITYTSLSKTGSGISARQNLAMVGNDSIGLVGFGYDGRTSKNDMYRYEVSGTKVDLTLLTAEGDVPSARTGLVIVGTATTGLIGFGQDSGGAYKNDVYRYAVSGNTITYTALTASGDTVSARWFLVMVGDATSGLIGYGHDGSNDQDDIYSYAVSGTTITFTTLTKAGATISARELLVMVGTKTSGLIGFGSSNAALNDMYRYVLSSTTITFTALTAKGDIPLGRWDLVAVGNATSGLLGFGNSNLRAPNYNEIYRFAVSGDDITYTLLTSSGATISERRGLVMVGNNTSGLIGFGFGSNSEKGDIYKYVDGLVTLTAGKITGAELEDVIDTRVTVGLSDVTGADLGGIKKVTTLPERGAEGDVVFVEADYQSDASFSNFVKVTPGISSPSNRPSNTELYRGTGTTSQNNQPTGSINSGSHIVYIIAENNSGLLYILLHASVGKTISTVVVGSQYFYQFGDPVPVNLGGSVGSVVIFTSVAKITQEYTANKAIDFNINFTDGTNLIGNYTGREPITQGYYSYNNSTWVKLIKGIGALNEAEIDAKVEALIPRRFSPPPFGNTGDLLYVTQNNVPTYGTFSSFALSTAETEFSLYSPTSDSSQIPSFNRLRQITLTGGNSNKLRVIMTNNLVPKTVFVSDTIDDGNSIIVPMKITSIGSFNGSIYESTNTLGAHRFIQGREYRFNIEFTNGSVYVGDYSVSSEIISKGLYIYEDSKYRKIADNNFGDRFPSNPVDNQPFELTKHWHEDLPVLTIGTESIGGVDYYGFTTQAIGQSVLGASAFGSFDSQQPSDFLVSYWESDGSRFMIVGQRAGHKKIDEVILNGIRYDFENATVNVDGSGHNNYEELELTADNFPPTTGTATLQIRYVDGTYKFVSTVYEAGHYLYSAAKNDWILDEPKELSGEDEFDLPSKELTTNSFITSWDRIKAPQMNFTTLTKSGAISERTEVGYDGSKTAGVIFGGAGGTGTTNFSDLHTYDIAGSTVTLANKTINGTNKPAGSIGAYIKTNADRSSIFVGGGYHATSIVAYGLRTKWYKLAVNGANYDSTQLTETYPNGTTAVGFRGASGGGSELTGVYGFGQLTSTTYNSILYKYVNDFSANTTRWSVINQTGDVPHNRYGAWSAWHFEGNSTLIGIFGMGYDGTNFLKDIYRARVDLTNGNCVWKKLNIRGDEFTFGRLNASADGTGVKGIFGDGTTPGGGRHNDFYFYNVVGDDVFVEKADTTSIPLGRDGALLIGDNESGIYGLGNLGTVQNSFRNDFHSYTAKTAQFARAKLDKDDLIKTLGVNALKSRTEIVEDATEQLVYSDGSNRYNEVRLATPVDLDKIDEVRFILDWRAYRSGGTGTLQADAPLNTGIRAKTRTTIIIDRSEIINPPHYLGIKIADYSDTSSHNPATDKEAYTTISSALENTYLYVYKSLDEVAWIGAGKDANENRITNKGVLILWRNQADQIFKIGFQDFSFGSGNNGDFNAMFVHNIVFKEI